ncbi:Mo-co oxidoreductase dimerisation domain-containing protein [Raineyella antarctica]|uniref:Mo-co oxidoreductase dimerisation domain-containing protein n=1 Tax=Raineyella antarctica TaxID=1577474 RepID=A0A1G6HHU3_9ACTN|nr:sulfite oxidase [Raineyella antarctica]SDB93515.1 Mo-co oxidoreductase dimerisation domain-containing protein [Raineyella antarctica]
MDVPQSPDRFSLVELQNAFRNRGMPLEALRSDITPTGLHYLLVHFDIPEVDADSWRLRIDGHVDTPLSLSLADLLARPSRSVPVTLECAGNGRGRMAPRAESQPWLLEAIGTADWTGTPLRGVLAEAGLRDGAVEWVFTGADHGMQGGVEQDYQRALTLAEADGEDVLLAYAMNGRPLEPQHGAPVRLLVPGWYGMTSVKWLTRIEAVTEPFGGYQQAEAYRYQSDPEDPGEPVTRIRVRALMVPPGFPDFPDRQRYVDAGPVTIRGRAWSGQAPVVRVEVGVDGQWCEARLEAAPGRYAWRAWSGEVDLAPGPHVLACRATDAAGNTQPEEVWNVQGMGNNAVQQVPVLARSGVR